MTSTDLGQPEGRNPDTTESEKQIAAEESSYFVIRVGNSYYAFSADYVDFIGPVEQPTPVPTAPTYILGISHVRGRILTVIDFPRILQLSSSEIVDDKKEQSYRRLVILRCDNRTIGIIVDEALGLNLITKADIRNAGQDTDRQDETVEFIGGQFDFENHVVTILNPKVMLSALVTPVTGLGGSA